MKRRARASAGEETIRKGVLGLGAGKVSVLGRGGGGVLERGGGGSDGGGGVPGACDSTT